MLTEERRSRGIAAIAIFVLVAVASLATWDGTQSLTPAPSANAPEPREDTQTNDNSANNEVAAIALLVGNFITGRKDEITALSTALLAIITCGLAFIARNQYKTSQAQLRAYVFLEKAFVERKGIKSWSVKYTIKNYGATPAHKVTLTDTADAIIWRGDETKIPTPTSPVQMGSMAPNGDYYDNEPIVNGRCNLVELSSGVKAIYLVGRVDYIDVFGLKRWSRFQYYIGGDLGYTSNELYADDKGNDAN